MAAMTFSLPADLLAEIDAQAYEERRSKSEIIQDAIREYVERKKRAQKRMEERKGA